jgi:hypothetical protein
LFENERPIKSRKGDLCPDDPNALYVFVVHDSEDEGIRAASDLSIDREPGPPASNPSGGFKRIF